MKKPDEIYFLRKLAQLIIDYDAEFLYTNDDDGIHINIGGPSNRYGEEIYIGWLDVDAAKKILNNHQKPVP